MEINKKIKTLRLARNLSTYELSSLTGISQSTISKLENGKRKADIEILQKIADAFGVPLDYLLRKSPKSIIEDKLEELNMTFEELSDKAKIPMIFFENLDNIIPDEGDYERLNVTARVLNIEPKVLANALYRQEPPVYDGWQKNAKEDFSDRIYEKFDSEYNIKELAKEAKEIENTLEKAKKIAPTMPFIPEEFTVPEEARAYINKHQIFGSDGFNPNKLTDDEILQFANELLNQMKMVSYKYKK